MDFCSVILKAQKNGKSNDSGIKYYSTKFEPPKKVKKESKDLSENIKKFLAKKEAEELEKQAEAKRKKDELLALRSQDKSATRRVNVMLKRTKSANQSVIEDAIDKTHTAVTITGPEQPDEDDYGYVSQEASAYYNKMMEKYSKIPEEKKFDMFKKKVSTNLNSTKDRVKAALEREREEAMQPHRRRRKHKTEISEKSEQVSTKNDNDVEKKDTPKEIKNPEKPKAKPKPAPPPMSFNDLLKIAEKKQFEPIVVEQKPKEEEKLFTKKQKEELEKDRKFREQREARLKDMELKEKQLQQTANNSKNNTKDDIKNGLVHKEKQLAKPTPKDKPVQPLKSTTKTLGGSQKSDVKLVQKTENAKLLKPEMGKTSKETSQINKIPSTKPSLNKNVESRPSSSNKTSLPMKKDIKTNIASGKLSGKPKEFPPRDLKPKQFPPPDIRGIKRKKPMQANKGRILDDSDEEYDSEMDDFIDDDPSEQDNYSTYIKEIFGYDKSRYRDIDEDVDNMESSFAQQMKEEVRSKNIAIKEDLIEQQLEDEYKRKKAILKKKNKQ